VDQHHDAILDRLSARFDVDRTDTERQLSLGMRVASMLGAFAFCAAVFFFFYRHWGRFTLPAQVGLLVAGPVLGLALTEYAAKRERTLYFAWLAGLVTCACFVLSLEALGRIYSLPSSSFRYLAWGGFGLALARTYRFKLVAAAVIVALTVFVLGFVTDLTGAWWTGFLSRQEGLVLAGVGWVGLLALRPDLVSPEFSGTVRLTGAVIAFIGLLVLGLEGNTSLLPLDRHWVEGFYDVLSFAAGVGGVTLGIRRGWNEIRIASTGFLVVLLVVKAFDWWWEWLPRELFFLVLGLMAIAMLVVLRRWRTRLV
jgi:uncharacterized membrane protein